MIESSSLLLINRSLVVVLQGVISSGCAVRISAILTVHYSFGDYILNSTYEINGVVSSVDFPFIFYFLRVIRIPI
jgi:hypothetical protein